MRTTLNIDDDILERARKLAAKSRIPFKQVINETLRVGMDLAEKPLKHKRYKTKPIDMGLRAGRNLDNIGELLAQVEGEGFR